MAFRRAEIIFNNTPSKYNRELTTYLKRKLKDLNLRGALKFHFKAVESPEFHKLRQKGITRLPAMVIQGKKFIGVKDIIAELQSSLKSSKRAVPKMTDDEFLDKWQKDALTDGVQKDQDGKFTLPDERDETEMDLGGAALREAQRRGLGNEGGNRRGNRPAPRQPDRNAEQDNDYDDYDAAPRRMPPRPDNLAEAGDPMATIDHIARKTGGDQDDELLKQMMLKIGGDD
jgi:hypothetical protein